MAPTNLVLWRPFFFFCMKYSPYSLVQYTAPCKQVPCIPQHCLLSFFCLSLCVCVRVCVRWCHHLAAYHAHADLSLSHPLPSLTTPYFLYDEKEGTDAQSRAKQAEQAKHAFPSLLALLPSGLFIVRLSNSPQISKHIAPTPQQTRHRGQRNVLDRGNCLLDKEAKSKSLLFVCVFLLVAMGPPHMVDWQCKKKKTKNRRKKNERVMLFFFRSSFLEKCIDNHAKIWHKGIITCSVCSVGADEIKRGK